MLKKLKLSKFLVGLLTLSFISFPISVFADVNNSEILGGCGLGGDGPHGQNGEEIECIVLNATQWILGIAGLIVVLMIIIGGVRYIVSAGNQAQAEGAKKTIVGAFIGLIIIILSALAINVVTHLLGGGSL